MNQLAEYSLGNALQSKSSIQCVGIVGCGSVGQEITLLIAKAGIEVVFVDISKERVKEIMIHLGNQLDDEIHHWGMTSSEKRLVLSRIKGTADYNDLKNCNIVIEAISSRKRGTMLEVRQELFRKIESVVRDDTVISSQLSTLMISDLASALEKPERTIGLHFIDPISKTHIVEVSKGQNSSEEALNQISRLCRMLKRKVVVLNESPGNISTRIIIPFINDACELLSEGVASIEDIDSTMKEASGHHIGPFELADRIGLDKVLKYMENLYAEFGERKYKASPIIKKLVRANYLGRTTGKGFYKYENGKTVGNTVRFVID
jgi:3-hydroxybutyryl-CoA dehydrogenase